MYIISFINLFVDVMCRFDDEEVVQKPSGRVIQVAVKAGGGRHRRRNKLRSRLQLAQDEKGGGNSCWFGVRGAVLSFSRNFYFDITSGWLPYMRSTFAIAA